MLVYLLSKIHNTTEINMKQEIQLSCFVVPNPIQKLGYVTISNVNGTHIWDKDVDELERMSKFGVWPVRGARYIQVWIHCPAEGENSNWTDHGIPEQYKNMFGYHNADRFAYAPSVLPMKYLMKFKEGETTTLFENDNCIVTLKFEQLPYRYGRFGRFEEVVEKLVQAFSDEEEDAFHKKMGEVIPVSGSHARYSWAMSYTNQN